MDHGIPTDRPHLTSAPTAASPPPPSGVQMLSLGLSAAAAACAAIAAFYCIRLDSRFEVQDERTQQLLRHHVTHPTPPTEAPASAPVP